MSDSESEQRGTETTNDATKTGAGCSCCGSHSGETERRQISDERLLTETPIEATLPEDLQQAMGRILGDDPVETLEEWTVRLRRRIDGGQIDVEDLCHASDATDHWGEMDGERYHFQCFYDAVALSALAEEPVDVRTASPQGTVIEARADGTDELTVTPEGAVFSFGIAEDVTPSDGDLSPADVYGAVCPYVKAFPDAEAYEQWAGTVPAATAAMPLAGATAFAATLVE